MAPLDPPFNSVNDFLAAAKAAKKEDRASIQEKLSMLLDDASTFAVPPDFLDIIEEFLEDYGDEALKAISMFCLGKWIQIHQDMLQQHIAHNSMESALWTMNDLSKLSFILQGIADLGSFGGDDGWRQMIKETVSQAVLEHCEENQISPQDVL
jgi:hypothetical protein